MLGGLRVASWGSTRSWKLLQRLVIVLSNRAGLFMLGLVWGVDLKTSFFLQMYMRAYERAREKRILTERNLRTVNVARVEGAGRCLHALEVVQTAQRSSRTSRPHRHPAGPAPPLATTKLLPVELPFLRVLCNWRLGVAACRCCVLPAERWAAAGTPVSCLCVPTLWLL